MRRPTLRAATAATLLSLLSLSSSFTVVAAADAPALPCKDVDVDGHKFDLSPLKGPHTVVTTEFAPPSYYNRTYTIDICAPLERKEDVEERYKCPKGTHGMFFFFLSRGGGWKIGIE